MPMSLKYQTKGKPSPWVHAPIKMHGQPSSIHHWVKKTQANEEFPYKIYENKIDLYKFT